MREPAVTLYDKNCEKQLKWALLERSIDITRQRTTLSARQPFTKMVHIKMFNNMTEITI